MKNALRTIRRITVVAALLACGSLQGQNAEVPPKGEVVLTKLAPPVYPAIARQTRISGDVQVRVGVRRDGSIAEVAVVHGHPLLAPTALESAKGSQFKCTNCPEAGASYLLLYTFETDSDPDPCPDEKSANTAERYYPRVYQSGANITVVERALVICDPISTITKTKVRSAKCLYLWHCGWRVENPR